MKVITQCLLQLFRPDDKKFLITKLLPRRPARTLRASLDSLCEKIHKFEKLLQMHLKAQKTEPGIDTDFKMKRKEVWLQCQKSFFVIYLNCQVLVLFTFIYPVSFLLVIKYF